MVSVRARVRGRVRAMVGVRGFKVRVCGRHWVRVGVKVTASNRNGRDNRNGREIYQIWREKYQIGRG